MKDLLKFNHYFRKYKWTLVLGVVFLCIANLFLVWIPIFVRQTIDNIEEIIADTDREVQGVFETLFASEFGITLALFAGYITAAALIYGVLLFLTRQTLIVASRKIEYDIRNTVFDHLQKLPQEYFSKNKSGDIYTRATEDIVRLREYFGPAFMYMVNTLSRAGIIITIMVMVNPQLTMWALLPLPFLTGFAYWVSGFIHKRSHAIQKQYARLAGLVQEAYSSNRVIKAFNREDYEESRFDKENVIYRKEKLKLDLIESLFHPSLNFLIGFSIILVIWQGGMMEIAGAITVGNITEFVIYVTYLTWPVASLGYTLNLLQRSAASASRVLELLSEPVFEDVAPDHAVQAPDEVKEISFENVSFTYPGAEVPAIENISFTARKGETIGIVGRTGSGKTTLVQLIPRLYDVDSGLIKINGIDIRKIPVDQLRQKIGYVPQDIFLFSDTIGQNISFGRIEAGNNEIEQAADQAALLENVQEFDQQFETILGERGVTLSGGQKQRTSIARALIRKPEILILDDSLSAVDTNTENSIVHHLKNGLSEGIKVLISHRISSIQNADKIYVMHNGKIVEQGSHEQLLDQNGAYASMHRKQMIEQELKQI